MANMLTKKFWLALFLLLNLAFAATIPIVQAAADDDDDDDTGVDVADADADDEEEDDDDEDEDEDEEGGDEEETGLPFGPHPDVETFSLFPEYPDNRLPLGKPISLLLGFINKGSGTFNLTGIGAHLHSPIDISYYVQNLTARRVVDSAVGTRQQTSVEYMFFPDPSLEPSTFWFTAWVLYNNSRDEMFINTFVNRTIELYEPNTGLSASSSLLFLVLAGGIGFAGFTVLQKKKKTAGYKTVSSSGAPSESAGSSDEAQEDLPFYKPAAQPKVIRRSSSKSKKQ